MIGGAVLLGSGCGPLVEAVMVRAPNHGLRLTAKGDPPQWRLRMMGVDRQFRVDVGPPEASLRVWVLEPPAKAGGAAKDAEADGVARPRGTIITLHGYRNRGYRFLGKAKWFAEAGYRAIVVDLRGHGRSTGEWMTFGVQESRDIVQVIDALERQGLIEGRLGLWGQSYGASTAIMTAARDPRVDAVVSVSGFASLRRVAPVYVSRFMPLAWYMFGDDWVQRRVDAAGRAAGFDPDEADATAAMARVDGPVLIMHGEWDLLIPPAQGALLAEAAADREGQAPMRHVRLPLLGHVAAYFDPFDTIRRESVAWFDRHLAASEPADAEDAAELVR